MGYVLILCLLFYVLLFCNANAAVQYVPKSALTTSKCNF